MNKNKLISGFAIALFSISMVAMIAGMIGFQVTTQDNFKGFISTAFSTDEQQENPISGFYDELIEYCQSNPGAVIDIEEDSDLPFTFDCNEVIEFTEDDLFDYIIDKIANSLWLGEKEISDMFGEDGSDEDDGFGEIFQWFTSKGNAAFYALVVFAIIPATWSGIGVLNTTIPGRKVRRFGMVFLTQGIIGLIISIVVFSSISSMISVGGDGPDIGFIIGLFQGPFYNTFMIIMVIGIILILIHFIQKLRKNRMNPEAIR